MTKVNELLAALSEDVIVQGRGVYANSWFDLELPEALEVITQAIVEDDGLQYLRVKPEVIFIGGMEVPKPEGKAPSFGKMYFTPSLTDEMLYDAMTWKDDSYDEMYLERGLVHLNSDAAIVHAQALLSLHCKPK